MKCCECSHCKKIEMIDLENEKTRFACEIQPILNHCSYIIEILNENSCPKWCPLKNNNKKIKHLKNTRVNHKS